MIKIAVFCAVLCVIACSNPASMQSPKNAVVMIRYYPGTLLSATAATINCNGAYINTMPRNSELEITVREGDKLTAKYSIKSGLITANHEKKATATDGMQWRIP